MNKHATCQDLRAHLAYLKLAAIAEHLPAALETAERERPGYTQFLHDLLGVEVDATEQRRLAGRMRFAGFPSTKTLEEFDFTAQPGIDRAMVNELATLRFVQETANLLLIGPPGVGKTMLAIALGLKAVETGYRVHYTTAADLVARTSRAADQGRWENTMRFWAGPQVLIVDELGYLPMVGEAGSHLFQVISRRYLHGTVTLTTNRSRVGDDQPSLQRDDSAERGALPCRQLPACELASTRGLRVASQGTRLWGITGVLRLRRRRPALRGKQDAGIQKA
jgi:DNA replication protein DnaC